MTLTISDTDHDQIRVFAMDTRPDDPAADGFQALFGAALDPTYVDVVTIADLGDMHLTDYISQGYDMTPDAADHAALNAIKGCAILVMSRATSGQNVTLTLAQGLRHVTTLSRDLRLEVPDKLSADTAAGTLAGPSGKPPKSDARISGMVATVALIVMMLLVGLMIWIA